MNQASPQSNMNKSTAEAIKQIQKKGLSISIVSRDSPRPVQAVESVVSKELKPKQIVSIDKSPKLSIRSPAPTENKPSLSQVRPVPITTAETRPSPPNQSVFQETKLINRQVPISTTPETRAFGSQSWSNPPPSSESKLPNRTIQSAVTYTESKTPVRISQTQAAFDKGQNMKQTECKSQGRIGQVNVHSDSKQPGIAPRNHLTFEGKLPKNPLNSPPLEAKRQTQNFESKGIQKTIPQVMAESKTVQTKLTPGRITELPSQLTANQIMKGTPRQPNKVILLEQQSTPLSNVAMNNSFRMSLGEKSSTPMEEKFIKVSRVSQNVLERKNQMANVQGMQSESKSVSQVVKISSGSSNCFQKIPVSFDNLLDTPSQGMNTMSSVRSTPKRPQVSRTVTSSPAKRKCIKRSSPNAGDQDGTNVETNNLDAGTPKKIEMQGITRGLTITPVCSAATASTSSGSIKRTTETTQDFNERLIVVICPHCSHQSQNINICDNCQTRIPPNTTKYHMKKVKPDVAAMFVEQKIFTTTSRVEKKIVYLPSDMSQGQSFFQQAVQEKVRIQTSTPVQLGTRGGRGRARTRRKAEPICYTLSSDEEDPMPFHPMEGSSFDAAGFTVDSECSNSENSNSDEGMLEGQESDDPQFPGVMDINPNVDGEEEPEYDDEDPEEEEETLSDENEEEESEQEQLDGKPTEHPLQCRSIRIGSYKVHPPATCPYVAVILQVDSISFNAPVLDESNKQVVITLRNEDIRQLVFHFGRCLPIMFVFTTPRFGEIVRNALHMIPNGTPYFEPSYHDDKTEKLTFLIENMSEDQKNFIRQVFPGESKVKEIDQKTANEILVKSTPQATINNFVKVKSIDTPSITVATLENQLPQISNQISVTKVIIPPQPVVKLLTFPPPPQTGGITITNEDLACLNEGEFLNDAIIDFYLKYVLQEKLTPENREKTHIFSSFFYPRLTHKPEKLRVGDDPTRTMQVRRHSQVKTWTRHIDIFSKDYIIIPVNQNVHWFLAIICYPNRVPDAPNLPQNKAPDNVTSTDEPAQQNKVTIKEITSNGDDNSPNQDDNSMNSGSNSPYEVEEPPDSDECSETPDSTTHPDGKQRKEIPCICIFDSLSGPNRWRIANILREYLEMEWKSKKGTRKVFDKNTMQGFIMKCPQQTNFSDCGMYLLQFVESFFENPIRFGTPMPDLTDWFDENKINNKRKELQNLILNLKKQQDKAARKSQTPNRNQSSSSSMQQTDNR